MIDSHCHLADQVFAVDLDAVIDRARAAGVGGALVILEAGNKPEAAQAERIVGRWSDVRFAIGVHPHQAHTFASDPAAAADLVRGQILRTTAARAVGEIGLDYHYDYSPREVQQAVFRAQLRVARELDRPVVVHTREAEDDTIAILREEGGTAIRGVLHCFTGTDLLADQALELGWYISLAGIVTFGKADNLRATARRVPAGRLLTETDSPFLAPVPHRGRRNEPAFVAEVVSALATLRDSDRAELARTTAANFHTLFRP